jgi:hypothetical protein
LAQEESHANQKPPKKNDVIIFLPSRDEIFEAIYLKDNKAASSDSIAAELLKSGGPSLVNALTEMIQQVTLPGSWIEGVLCPQCSRRAINLIARIIAASAD